MEIDIQGIISYEIGGKAKESSSSEPTPPQQGEVCLLEEFDFEIPKITPIEALLNKIMKRQKKADKKMSALFSLMMMMIRSRLLICIYDFLCFCS